MYINSVVIIFSTLSGIHDALLTKTTIINNSTDVKCHIKKSESCRACNRRVAQLV